MKKHSYRIERIPPMRRFAFDAGYLGRRRHIVHGLIQVDVTDARSIIQEQERIKGERLSFTAFIIHSLSKAIEEHPHLHAYRDWRGRLVIFEDINIVSMLEVDLGAGKIPMPHRFEATNRKTLYQIHQEMRSAQKNPQSTREARFMGWFLYVPTFIRRLIYRILLIFPPTFRDISSSVMVTAVGMFGEGGGWAITMPNFTLNVAVGGTETKLGIHDGEIVEREYLDLTVSIDHDIVDGAPAARFVQTFRSLLEASYGLRDVETERDLAI